jgi:hypothetical protein
MTIDGQPVARQRIHDELERVRGDLHGLIAGATADDLARRTDGPGG